ncbi:hypothetical protein D3C84_1030600 [compost metagenome]
MRGEQRRLVRPVAAGQIADMVAELCKNARSGIAAQADLAEHPYRFGSIEFVQTIAQFVDRNVDCTWNGAVAEFDGCTDVDEHRRVRVTLVKMLCMIDVGQSA